MAYYQVPINPWQYLVNIDVDENIADVDTFVNLLDRIKAVSTGWDEVSTAKVLSKWCTYTNEEFGFYCRFIADPDLLAILADYGVSKTWSEHNPEIAIELECDKAIKGLHGLFPVAITVYIRGGDSIAFTSKKYHLSNPRIESAIKDFADFVKNVSEVIDAKPWCAL